MNVVTAEEAGGQAQQTQAPSSEDAPPKHPPSIKERGLEALRRFTRARRHEHLERLQASRTAVFEKLREIPDRMQKLTNQVRLLLDLVDDYWAGRYRQVSWYSLAVAVLGTLYFVSPSDLVPDYIPVLGQLDDMAVVAIALQILQRDLRRYCEFKGFDTAAYF